MQETTKIFKDLNNLQRFAKPLNLHRSEPSLYQYEKPNITELHVKHFDKNCKTQ